MYKRGHCYSSSKSYCILSPQKCDNFYHTYLYKEDGRGEDEGHGPGGQHRLLGPAQRAEVLRLQGVHDGVVSFQQRAKLVWKKLMGH